LNANNAPVYLRALTVSNVLQVPGLWVAVLYVMACTVAPRLLRKKKKNKKQKSKTTHNGENEKAVSESEGDTQRILMAIFNGSLSFASVLNLYYFLQSAWMSGPESIFFHSAGLHQQVVARAFWLYRVLKYVELIDTALIILRGKWRQLSFLHVYHHASILVLAEIGYHFSPWMSVVPFVAMNSFVHVLMYGYWAFRSYLGSDSMPIVVKKVITIVQIVQFALALIHGAIGYVHYQFCPYAGLYSAFFVFLFSRFYARAYYGKIDGKKLH